MDENTFVSDDGGEMLLMDSACLWMWIPYISQDKLPIGTVAAGHDVNKEPLYIARAMFLGKYSIGFYRFRKLLGYFVVHIAVSTNTEIDILVVLWLSYCFIAARYSVNLVWYWRNQYINIEFVTADGFHRWLIQLPLAFSLKPTDV